MPELMNWKTEISVSVARNKEVPIPLTENACSCYRYVRFRTHRLCYDDWNLDSRTDADTRNDLVSDELCRGGANVQSVYES